MDSINSFLRACADGNVKTVTSLIDNGFNIDSSNEENITGLQMAAANGQEEIVKLLIVKGASLDKCNVFGWTPLHHAARQGHTRIAAALLQSQADLNARNSLGCDVLTAAARGGHVNMCNLLIEAGIDTSHGVISKGPTDPGCDFTPLMVAALLGNQDLCKTLLEKGAGVDVRCSPLGVSPLMLASMNSDEKLVKYFIEKGSNPDLTEINGRTALDFSICCSNKQVQSYLSRITTCKPKIEMDEWRPDIIEAVKRGNLQRVREILDIDICQRDATQREDGATPLMFAAIAGRLDIAQILVEKGCNINKQDTVNGWTALMQAIYYGKKLVAKYLIDFGADVTIAATNGCTAFDMVTLLDDVDTDLYRLLASIVSVYTTHKLPNKSDTLSSNKSKSSLRIKKSRPSVKNWWTRISDRFKKLNKNQSIYAEGYKIKSYDNSNFNEQSENSHRMSYSVGNGLTTLKVTASPSSILSYSTDNESVAGSYQTMRSNDLDLKYSKINDNLIQTGNFSFQNPPIFPNDKLQMPAVKDASKIRLNHMTFSDDVSCGKLSLSNLDGTSPSSSSSSKQLSNFTPSTLTPSKGVHSSASSSTGTITPCIDNLEKSAEVNMVRRHDFSIFKTFDDTKRQYPHIRSALVTPHIHKSKHKKSTNKNHNSRRVATKSTNNQTKENSINKINENLSTPFNEISDDLGGLLQKLSMERYQTIFEEQEVDMDAFLILTDSNLQELGITQPTCRQQLLSTIDQLNLKKRP